MQLSDQVCTLLLTRIQLHMYIVQDMYILVQGTYMYSV